MRNIMFIIFLGVAPFIGLTAITYSIIKEKYGTLGKFLKNTLHSKQDVPTMTKQEKKRNSKTETNCIVSINKKQNETQASPRQNSNFSRNNMQKPFNSKRQNSSNGRNIFPKIEPQQHQSNKPALHSQFNKNLEQHNNKVLEGPSDINNRLGCSKLEQTATHSNIEAVFQSYYDEFAKRKKNHLKNEMMINQQKQVVTPKTEKQRLLESVSVCSSE